MSDDNKGPWGGNGSGDNPWGGKKPTGNNGRGRGRKPNNDIPDLEEILKNAQNKFMGGGKGSEKTSLIWMSIILLIIWGSTGFYRVLPEEHAVLMTFGEWTGTKDSPGLHYHIPYPIQSTEKVNVSFVRRIQVGSIGNKQDGTPSKRAGRVQSESLMVTGDENIIDIDFVVLWRVSDAGKFLFEIRDPESTIKKVAESAMREVIGRTKIQDALTGSREDIEFKTKDLMQKILDEYQSGALITDVQMQDVNPPQPVVDAFDDVQRAKADKERLKNNADAYKNDIIPKARGKASRMLQEADAYKSEVVNRAKGDADRFKSVYKAYSVSKDVTRKRIYIETMQEVLTNSNKIILDDSGTGVLPYLPLDKLNKK